MVGLHRCGEELRSGDDSYTVDAEYPFSEITGCEPTVISEHADGFVESVLTPSTESVASFEQEIFWTSATKSLSVPPMPT